MLAGSNNFGGFSDASAQQWVDQLAGWSNIGDLNSGSSLADVSNLDPNFNTNALSGMGSTGDVAQNRSNQLVRRSQNQQLAARNGGNQWQAFGDTGQATEWQNNVRDGHDDLEKRALAAKKDAQAKRKQIPPFVQKLSRLVDPWRASGFEAKLTLHQFPG